MLLRKRSIIDNLRWISLHWIIGMIMISLLLVSCGSGGGGGGAQSGRPALNMKVVLGPIVNATVEIAMLDDRNVIIASGYTLDSDILSDAGQIEWDGDFPSFPPGPLCVRVYGGLDIDVDDDGIRGPEEDAPMLHFVMPNASYLMDLQATTVLNPLLLFASRYVFDNLGQGYEITDDHVNAVLDRVANALIIENVCGPEGIGWEDIACFDPLVDKAKSRIPWEYVVDSMARSRRDYFAELNLHYARSYYLDTGVDQQPLPYDWNKNGDWRDDKTSEYDESFGLFFMTNKNGYTFKDLVEGQGMRGGSVVFPGNKLVSYFYGYPCGDSYISGEQSDVNWVPLDTRCGDQNDALSAMAGGNIINPKTAPVGPYEVNYITGDGLEHQEIMFVFENSESSGFFPIPDLTINDEGHIETFKLRFENLNGDTNSNPPILSGICYFQLWGDVDKVNSLVRGTGYYRNPDTNMPPDTGSYAYQTDIDITNPTDVFYPVSNATNKIFFEDLLSINLWFIGGDGVTRAFPFSRLHPALSPSISSLLVEDGKLSAEYSPSLETNREVINIKHKFDEGPWVEVEGSSIENVDIPLGALKLYMIPKDESGFYYYPPYEYWLN